VARMQAQNDIKLKHMQANNFEEKKALRDYYNQQVSDARDGLAKDRAEMKQDYTDKAQRNEEDYHRLRDYSEKKLDQKSSEYKMNTARLKANNDKKLTNEQRKNKKAMESSRGYYEGNIQNLNKTNRENLSAQKAAYDKELKDSQDATSKTYNKNLEELNRDYQERMDKTIDGYEQRLSSEKTLSGRARRQKDLSIKLLKQKQADQLELQQENNRESKRIMAEDNKKNLDQLRKSMKDNNALQNVGAQGKINNLEDGHSFEVASLKMAHEKEIRELDRNYKLTIKKDRDHFRQELGILEKHADVSQRKMEAVYREKIDSIQEEYRRRLKENDLS